MIAKEDIKAGTPLYINYKSMNNSKIFMNYGFICENNSANNVPVWI